MKALRILLFLFGPLAPLCAQDIAITARHAPTINGQARVEGSVQMLLGGNVTFNGGATLSQDFLVPGTPTVTTNGNVTWQGVQVGSGATTPTGYTVRLNGGVALRYVRTRTNAVTIPSVPAPPVSAGTRAVTINHTGQSAGNFATLRDLTLNGNVGQVAVPAGTYRNFTANGGSGFTLGVAGATQPAVYALQTLTLNGQATINVVGPVVIHLANGLNVNGQAGVAAHPEWLQVKIAVGGVTINGGATLRGSILAPSGEVKINGQGTLCGTAMCDSFRLNGGGLVTWCNTSGGGGNQAPVATPQNHVTTAEDVAQPIVLAGTDADGNPLTFTVASQPLHGTLSGAGATRTYTPLPEYFGPDSFTFTANDGTATSAPATVSITVTPINDVPVAQAQTVNATEDTPANLVLMGTDLDGDTLSYSIVSGPLHGTLSGAGPNRTYTPAADYHGPDSFVFRVDDGTVDSASVTVTINVGPIEEVPVANPLTVTTPEDQWVNVTLTGSDPEGAPLTFHVATAPLHGVLSGTLPNLVYTPTQDFHGPDSFTYYASDSFAGSTPATVAIHVTPVNDPPVAAALTAATNEDTAANFTLPATDADGDALTYEIIAAPAHGTLSGAAPNLLYTPAPNFFGTDTLTFMAHDAATGSAPAVVTFVVPGQPDAPTANAQAVALNEDAPATVLLNAQDVDGDPLTYSIVTLPAHGTLAPTGNPAAFLYTPAANYNGDDSFTFKVNDGFADSATAPVTLVMVPVRDVPVAASFAFATPEDQSAAVTLTGVDFDGYALFFTVLLPPQHGTLTGTGAELTYTPAADYFGPDHFIYLASDPYGDSDPAQVSITVTPVNDAPVATARNLTVAEDAALPIALAATDVENDALTYRVVTQPAHGTLTPGAPAGAFHYQPFAHYHGPDGFAFVADDGQRDSLPATIAIVVTPANDAPSAQPATFTTRENTPLAITLQGHDLDGDTLSFLAAVPTNGTVIPDSIPGSYTYLPAHDFHGTDTFTFTVSDGALVSGPAVVTIEVTPVNDSPTITATTPSPIVAPSAVALAGFAADDGDPSGSVLTVAWSKMSGPGEITFANAASATTTASYTLAGTYVLRATASDGELSASADVTVIVTMPNQPPVVEAGPAQTLALAATANLAGTVQDDGLPAGATLTPQWSQLSGPGAVTFGHAHALATSAAFSAPGDYVLRLRATDTALTGQDEVAIRVLAPNQPPLVYAGFSMGAEINAALALNGSVTDDGLPRGTALGTQWTLVSGPDAPSFADPFSPTTTVRFSALGEYVLRLTAGDGEYDASDLITVYVNEPVNPVPVVDAGLDHSTEGSATTLLRGSVTVGGLPSPPRVDVAWFKSSGPGAVSFANRQSPVTNVRFAEPGTYVLGLTAYDPLGELSASDSVTVTVTLAGRQLTVDAGPDQSVLLVDGAFPRATVTFQEQPEAGAPALAWSKISGSGEATFTPADSTRPRVSFTAPASYVLELTATHGSFTASDRVTITVAPACLPAPEGLAGWWAGEGDATDALGRNPGVLLGGTTFTPGQAGSAFQLDGLDDAVRIPASGTTDLGGSNAFTVECWIKTEDVSTPRPIFSWGNNASGVHLFTSVPFSGCLFANIRGIDGSDNTLSTFFGIVQAGRYHHVALTFNRLTSRARIYLDGVEYAFNFFFSDVRPNTLADLRIGSRGPGEHWPGVIDEFSTYTRELSAAEIAAIHRSGVAKCAPAAGIPENIPPSVTAGPDRQVSLGLPVRLDGRVVEDGLPLGSAHATYWTVVSGNGSAGKVLFADATDPRTEVTFPAGNIAYVLRLHSSDGEYLRTDDVTFIVQPTPPPDPTPTLTPITDWQQEWRYKVYALDAVPANVAAPDFDSSDYQSGTAAFASGGACALQSTRGTDWPVNTDLVIRRSFTVPEGATNLHVQGSVDNFVRVWVNGTDISGGLISAAPCNGLGTRNFDFPLSILNVQSGENQIVVLGRDEGVESLLDVRIVAEVLLADAGLDQQVAAGQAVTLDASGSLEVFGSGLTYHWRQTSGPTVLLDLADPVHPVFHAPSFANAVRLHFSLWVESARGVSTPDEVVVDVAPAILDPANSAPVVDAGVDREVPTYGGTVLNGIVTDDGFPAGSLVTARWSVVYGPGPVTFAQPDAAVTAVSFGSHGEYRLRLTASDGQLVNIDDVLIGLRISAGENGPPAVSAGPDRNAIAGEPLLLSGSASDDGQPLGAPPALTWSKRIGPGDAAFGSPQSAVTGVVFSAPGTYLLTLTASDSLLTTADEVVITVAAAANQAPQVDLGPDRTVGFGQSVTLTPEIDDDGLPAGLTNLSYEQSAGPRPLNAVPDAQGGYAISFPAVGSYTLRLTAHDGEYSVSDEVLFTVIPAATAPPTVALTAPATGAAFQSGQTITLQAAAADPDAGGGIVSVAFYDGATLLGTDGSGDAHFTWTGAALGAHTLTAVATDVSGTTTASAAIFVHVTPAMPAVALTYPIAYSAFAPGESVQVQATASPGGTGSAIAQVEFLLAGAPPSSDATAPYATTWLAPSTPGEYTFTAHATDTAGQTATSAPVLIRVAADPTAPTIAEITSPAAGASVTAPTLVLGTVDGPQLAGYVLEYQKIDGCGEWVPFASGTRPVSNGTLGTFDPTQLLNGLYQIRLKATEANGGLVTTTQDVVVHGDMKVGEFTFSTQDLSIQLPGLSLEVTRTYHSTKKCADDFGPGWDLDINAVRLFKNARIGDDWYYDIFIPDNFFVPPSFSLNDAAPHIIAVVFPNGETYRFRPVLALKNPRTTAFTEPYGNAIGQTFLPLQYNDRLKVVYQPLPGAEGVKLVPRAYRAVDPLSNGSTTVAGDADLFLGDPTEGLISLAIFENTAQDAPLVVDASGFDLVMPDGRVFRFGEDGRLERLTDRTGNWVEIRANGVFHSSGPAVTWTRNAAGRISEVQDLRGGRVEYLYDAVGQLTGVKDRVGSVTSYEYEPASSGINAGKLKRILDPSGIPQLGNEYQPDGRLFLQQSAANNALVRMVHNLTTRTEQMIDPLGKITTITYDARGQVTESRDPLGHVTRFAYDEAGRRIAVENPLGHVQRFAFAQGMRTYTFPGEGPGGTDRVEHQSEPLVTRITDPEGAAFNYIYNSQSRPTQLTDALGESVALGYDASGNVTGVTDPLGNVTRFTYNARGQIASRTDAEGHATTYQYNAQGRMSGMTDALGHSTAMTYDSNGNELTRTVTRTRSDGVVETLTTAMEYDANDRLVKTTDALGRETHTVYDANGRVAETIDSAGRSTRSFYDPAGRPIRTEYPDGTSTRQEYDLAGYVVKTIDALNRETRSEYDDAGRRVKTIAPDGAETVTTYDAAGRVTATTDALGRTSHYAYDRAGRRTLVRNAVNEETVFAYDANGNLIETEDALGRVTTHTYDVLNRRTATTHADGTTQSVAYDDLGRVISETDQAARTKSYAYDAVGRLLAVTDALNQTTAFSYDELGSQLTQIDALGRITRHSYDSLGRRVKRTLPLGMFETLGYDTAGNLATRTDFKGRTTTYQYDTLNRLTAKVPDPALGEPTVGFTYSSSGRRASMTDATGVTTYTYDTRDRLLSKSTPQGTLSYTYNLAGELTRLSSEQAEGIETSYAYDTLGRLGTVTDRELGATAYSYDAVGNLTQFTTPNGVTHSYTYSPLNRLTQMLVASVPATGPPIVLASYAYTLSPTGRRDSASETLNTQLSTLNRSASYSYDALDRLTRETITAATGPAGQTNYTYDAVGNRLTRTGTVPGLPPQNFGYDINDRLLSDTYDANGNTTQGQVPQPTVTQVPVPLPGETFVADSYDFEDRLTTRTGGGLTVTVLYNGDGQRVAETVNGQTVTYLVDDLNPTGYAQVVEERTNGTVTRTYTYGHDLLAQDTREGGNQWRAQYFGYDGQGSVRFLTDELAQITDTYAYDAFGTLLASTGTTANRYRYSGEEFAPGLGLYHLRARYLNAANGRFWSADTYEGAQGDPHSLHRYTYAYNNPVNLSDPSGHFPTLGALMCQIALGSTYGAIVGDAFYQQNKNHPALRGLGRGDAILGGAVLGAAMMFALPACGAYAAIEPFFRFGGGLSEGVGSGNWKTAEEAFTDIAFGFVTAGFSRYAAQLRAGIVLTKLTKSEAAIVRTTQGDRVIVNHAQIEENAAKGVTTVADDAAFWSGRAGANRGAAETSGSTTLERTPAGQALDAQDLFSKLPYDQAIVPWENLSRQFASEASGTVKAWVGGASPTSVWSRIEKPTLMLNPNVRKIIIQDATRPEKTRIIYK